MARRIHKKSKNKKSLIDDLAFAAAIIYPLMTLPQIIQIYSSQSAEDLSLLTWFSYVILEIIFLFYGIKHKLKPIFIASLLWLVVYVVTIIGIIIYN